MEFNNFFYYVRNRWDIFKKQQKHYQKDNELIIIGLGIGGEAGEVQKNIKKFIRDDAYILTPERKEKLILELGDVIHYWCRVCQYFDISPEEVLKQNKIKLDKRDERRKTEGLHIVP